MKCFPECACGGEGEVERGPAGATYSYPCYPWDCANTGCRCHRGTPCPDCVDGHTHDVLDGEPVTETCASCGGSGVREREAA